MKKLNIILFILVIICITGTAVFLIMSPARVPVHYDFSGKVDRIGSKYENIILPAIAAVMAVFFSYMARKSSQKGDEANSRIMIITGILSVALLTAIGFFLMWKAMKYAPGAEIGLSSGKIEKFTSIAIGILLILIGNYMPKATRNSAVGIRTKWSMANDEVWQKSQRFGGIAAVICGFVQIVISLFVPGMWNILVMTVIIAVLAAVCTVASYRYYKENSENNEK